MKCAADGVVNEDVWTEFISSLRFLIKIVEEIDNCFELKLVGVSLFKG